MFEHPQVTGAQQYVIEVALDGTSNPFEKVIVSRKDSSTATIIDNFEFGKNYVWRYAGVKNGALLDWHGPYTFKTLTDLHADKRNYRVRVITNDTVAGTGGLIALDNERVIVDRKGNFVWFLPADSGTRQLRNQAALPDNAVSDLRVTPQGTITALNHFKAEEIDLNGKVIWLAPVQFNNAERFNRTNTYNHAFKKLATGNYMVIDGLRGVKRIARGNGSDSVGTLMNDEIIREFDKQGKLVWNWNSATYFDSLELTDMVQHKADSGVLDPTPGGHMNAFDVDERAGFVYAGFRNISRVIKINKRTGEVVRSWGDKMKYNGMPNADGFFMKQHETTLLHDGNLAVYNNNLRPVHNNDIGIRASEVVIFSQPFEKETSKVLWKFECKLDSGNNLSSRGGSVDEMKNGNLLVGMGTVNKLFELTRDKRIVWSALIERRNPGDSGWMPAASYKVHAASSLYPCYFSVQTSADTVHKTSPTFQFKVYNVGSEVDSYVVDISSPSGYYKKFFSASDMAPGTYKTFIVIPNKTPRDAETIQISVQSKVNPDLKRTMQVQYH